MCDHSRVSQMLTKTLGVSPVPIAMQKSALRARARRYGMVRGKSESGVEVAQPFTSSSPGVMHSTPARLSALINTHDTVHKDCTALAFEPSDSTTPH